MNVQQIVSDESELDAVESMLLRSVLELREARQRVARWREAVETSDDWGAELGSVQVDKAKAEYAAALAVQTKVLEYVNNL